MSGDSKWRRRGKAVRADGIALTIPMVMIVFPVLGGLVGRYLAGYFEKPWILYVAIAAGMAMGVWESVRLVKELNRVTREK